jgi:hypothetical protein
VCRYEDLAGSARRLQVAGVYIRVASLQDVIASKEQANRAKDREDLPELYELRAKQGSTSPAPTPNCSHRKASRMARMLAKRWDQTAATVCAAKNYFVWTRQYGHDPDDRL